MKNRSWAVGATTLAMLAGGSPQLGQAEETLRSAQGVSCSADGGTCTHFQGYVYVHRSGPTAPVWGEAPAKGETALDGRRLYLHLGAADAH